MIRNSKTPTFVFIGLCIILFVMTYNYWNLTEENNMLNQNIILAEDKITNLIEKKAYLEKQTDINSEKVKMFEDKIAGFSNVMLKKDSELNEIKTQLDEKIKQFESFQDEYNKNKESLKKLNGNI